MQDCASSNKIKENKYKILRMSLLLGRGEDQEETLTNFEEAARDIDAMNNEIYLRDLEGKFYDTLKLEEEEKKLAVLVDYIGGRVEQRISLLSDFANVTGYDLTNLPPIQYYDKLDDYKDRLKYIREYLNNIQEMEVLNQEIETAETKLKEAYLNKATAEDYNVRNEEILLNKFENILKSTTLKEINKDNIDVKLNEIIATTEDSKKSLDIFNKSFATLSGSGISYEEEQEYKSYVDNAKVVYYENKEQEYLLRIYKYLLKSETEYNSILGKREAINDILYERINLRKELEVKEADILNNLYDLLERQYEDIKHQKDNIENIDMLNDSINQKKEKLNDLELDNQKVEILALLREFCLIDTYVEEPSNDSLPSEETTNIEGENNATEESIQHSIPEPTKLPSQSEENSSIPSSVTTDFFSTPLSTVPTEPKKEEIEESPKEEYKENQIIAVENVTNIDLEFVHAKASKVMQRVGEMLGIKTVETTIVSVENEKPKIEEKKVEEKTDTPPSNNPLPVNPLFNNDITATQKEGKQADAPDTDNSFWFSSDTPDALNELPDLEIKNNNNFFSNNQIPDLNFPDLKLNFGSNDNGEDQS